MPRDSSPPTSPEDEQNALVGLRPSFSADVRWCEHGAAGDSSGDRAQGFSSLGWSRDEQEQAGGGNDGE
jgi:hypothetical protein